MNLANRASLLSKLALLAAPALLAQGAPALPPPPPLMMFVREEVKPGHGAGHALAESAWARALAKGHATDHYLGMTAMTGPPEAWFLMAYGSYGEWEAKQKELDGNPAVKQEVDRIALQDGEHLSGSRSLLGTFRRDLSFGPPVEMGKMRYVRVRIFRVKQGQNRAFEEGVKLALDAYAKSRYPASFGMYEVLAGMGTPAYVALRSMRTLGEQDALDPAEKAFQEALGEEGRKAISKVFAETVNGVENQFFALDPKLSFPPPSIVASDPAFWTPKPPKAPAK